MKITIVLGPFQPLPPAGIGAVEKVWSELSQAFARAGHEVTIVCKRDPASGTIPGVVVVAVPGHSATGRIWIDLARDFLYALRVRRSVPAADVIVTNSFWSPVVLGASSPLRSIVVHVARFPKGQMGLYGRAAVLQAISSAVGDEIIRQSPRMRDKVRIVPYPVDLAVYCPPASPRRYDGDLVVLYVGRVHPEKGLEALVNAFRAVSTRLPRARLKIVGPDSVDRGGGGEPWVARLKDVARGLPVEFAGPISDPSKLALELQQAHCFCYPSLADKGEAFGLAVLEAMATELPVAVSDLACFRDFIEPGNDGLVFDHRDSGREARLADALVRILGDASEAARLGRNGLRRAESLSLDAVAGRYLELFQSVSANAGRH